MGSTCSLSLEGADQIKPVIDATNPTTSTSTSATTEAPAAATPDGAGRVTGGAIAGTGGGAGTDASGHVEAGARQREGSDAEACNDGSDPSASAATSGATVVSKSDDVIREATFATPQTDARRDATQTGANDQGIAAINVGAAAAATEVAGGGTTTTVEGGLVVRAPSAQDMAGEMMSAAKRGDAAEIERLLAAGADPNVRGMWQNTPLMVAAQYGHSELAIELVARWHCDPSLCNEKRVSQLRPSHTAPHRYTPHRTTRLLNLSDSSSALVLSLSLSLSIYLSAGDTPAPRMRRGRPCSRTDHPYEGGCRRT
jgi:hypothetical protein